MKMHCIMKPCPRVPASKDGAGPGDQTSTVSMRGEAEGNKGGRGRKLSGGKIIRVSYILCKYFY